MLDWLKDRWDDFWDWVKEYEKIILIVLGSLLGLGLILFLIFGVACRGYSSDPNAIRMGITSQNLTYMNYDEAVEILEDKGFTNIKVIESESWIFDYEGEVYKVSIDGCENFWSYSKFSPDDLVVVYYYK